MIIIFLILIMSFSVPVHAVTLGSTSIGGVYVATAADALSTIARQAASGFRGAFTPMNIGLALGTYAIMRATDAALNKYGFIPGRNNLGLPVPGWTGDSPPQTMPQGGYTTSGISNQTFFNTTGEVKAALLVQSDNYHKLYCGGATSVLRSESTNPSNGVYSVSYYNACYGGYFEAVASPVPCPSGYTLSSGVCVLSDQARAKWPSDGIPTYQQNSSGNWQPHPRDPDPASSTLPSGNSFSRTGNDTYGNPVKETFKNTPAGGMDYERQTEGLNPTSGQPFVQTDKFYFDQNGDLYNTTSNINNNSTINNPAPQQIDTSSLSQEATQQQVLGKLQEIASKNPTVNVNPNVSVQVDIPPIEVSGDGGVIPFFDRGQTPTTSVQFERVKNYLYSHPMIAPLVNYTSTGSDATCPFFLSVSMNPFGYTWLLETTVMCDLWELMLPTLDIITKFAFSLTAIYILFMA